MHGLVLASASPRRRALLAQIGITPLADTSIRLWHWGRYGFGWEDAGSTSPRYRSYNFNFAPPPEPGKAGG